MRSCKICFSPTFITENGICEVCDRAAEWAESIPTVDKANKIIFKDFSEAIKKINPDYDVIGYN